MPSSWNPRRAAWPVLCALAVLSLAGPAAATIDVDAGPDLFVASGEAAVPDASVTGLAPVEFWTADGDNGSLWQTENEIVSWADDAGLTTIGPLETADAHIYGWPSDFVEVGSTIYGIDTYFEQVYEVDALTGAVTPLGTEAGGLGVWDTRLGSLAYDPTQDVLYSIDWRRTTNRLYAFDLQTDTWTLLYTGLPFEDAHGLAWSEAESLLYLVDAFSGAILTLDPTDGTTSYVVTPAHDPGPILEGEPLDELFYDELQFFEGRLFGSLHARTGGVDYMQLQEIDLATGREKAYGPLIAETDAHSLLVFSVPERVTWQKVSGPGEVVFDGAADIHTRASFSADGTYVLALSVDAAGTPSDTVMVTVPEPSQLVSLVAGLDLLALLAERRGAVRARDGSVTRAQNFA
jgi:hypothetical protein